ncbi:hypothetical protein G6N73_34970 [Mesorhizobium camelthorni]|uniref:Glycosyltransferase n=1 Tax=Allomesorhizobium camelthorni TaxID=475069 RepID=A0A6G4WNF2_9HYPH|nr:hypothetical protein [Mesorhizobium camelthorni]
MAEHLRKERAEKEDTHAAKLREKDNALAEAKTDAEKRLQRALRVEKQNAELEEVGRQQQAELEYRQQLITQLKSRLSAMQQQLVGNPITLLYARRRTRRQLVEEAGKPQAAVGAVAKPTAKGASQAAKWVSLVPDQFRSIPPQTVFDENDRDFGVAVFGFNRPDLMEGVLTSLGHQKMLGRVHVFIDGDQGRPHARAIINEVADVAARFPVRAIHRRAGNLGFRKMMLQAMTIMSDRYDMMLFLEDDCFPTRDCCRIFRAELGLIAKQDDVFSVYGHPFGLPNETEYFTRFQGWGWGTTSAKLKPVLSDLVRCYWMDEADFLAFTHEAMTEEILQRIDVTPGRQPSVTLKRFFAWDETTCLLTALRGMKHKRTAVRVIHNCGAGSAGSHFTKVEHYRKPPFNMIAADEVWDHF